jgi:capsular exopolysaccharide synthesis family protein
VDEDFDLRRLFGVVRRHKYMIVGLAVVATVLAALYSAQLTPRYRAQAQVVLEQQRTNVVPMEELVRGTQMDWQSGQTEAALIQSRELAKRAVDKLNLKDSPLFNPALRPGSAREPGLMERAKGLAADAKAAIKGWLIDLGALEAAQPETPSDYVRAQADDQAGRRWSLPAEAEDSETSYYVSAYLSGLSVSAGDYSRIINITYSSTDPRFAAAAANTTAQIYIDSQREQKGEMANEAAQWLDGRVEAAKQELIEAERELERFREQAGITTLSGGQSLEGEQLAKLNAQLSDARARLAEARARYQQVQSLLETEGQIESAAAVLDSNLIGRLRLQEVELQRRIAELSSQYRDNHPKMVHAKAELEDLRERIRNEVAKIATNLRNEVEVAQTRVNNLEQELGQQRQRVNEMGDAQARLRALQSEVEANRQLYETLLDRFKEVQVQDERAQEADARLINRARTPGQPYYPKTNLIVASAFTLATMVALGLAFLLEYLDNGYRRLRDLEAHTGLPALGLVPRVRLKRGQMPHAALAKRRGSHFAEAIRMLRTGLAAHARRVDGARVVLITSSVPGEGKTTAALSLAAQDAYAGRDAVVLDCDLRVANLGNYLGHPDRLGLSDYLRGRAELSDILGRDPESGVTFIAAGSMDDHPDEILGSDRLRQLIETLSKEYSRVILDAPPVLAVADTTVLAPSSDVILYCVRWGETKRELVDDGLMRLVTHGAGAIYTALTLVDVRKQAQYGGSEGYYGYGAYYGAQ